MRRSPGDGIFLVGNAAGEAHPIIAEGISMAMQSALLLSRMLIGRRAEILDGRGLRRARLDYERAWRRAFAPRLRASWCFAQLALHSPAARLSRAIIERFPALLEWGAEWSGKTTGVPPAP
jgi:flavin-dependent dehydrogenase